MQLRTLYGSLATAALAFSLSACEREQPKALPEAPAAPEPAYTEPAPLMYTVQKGDGLAKIVREQLNLRGREALLNVQNLNKDLLTPDRDIYKPLVCSDYLNGDDRVGDRCPPVIAGKDGIADLIYPGEKLRLR